MHAFDSTDKCIYIEIKKLKLLYIFETRKKFNASKYFIQFGFQYEKKHFKKIKIYKTEIK